MQYAAMYSSHLLDVLAHADCQACAAPCSTAAWAAGLGVDRLLPAASRMCIVGTQQHAFDVQHMTAQRNAWGLKAKPTGTGLGEAPGMVGDDAPCRHLLAARAFGL